MIAVSSCNGEVSEQLLQTLMERTELQMKDINCRFIALGIAFTFLGMI